MASPETKRSIAAVQAVLSDEHHEVLIDDIILQALAKCQDHFIETVAEDIIASVSSNTAACFQVSIVSLEVNLHRIGIDDKIIQEAKSNVDKIKPKKKRKVQRQFTEADLVEQERLMAESRERFKNGKTA